MTQMNQEELEYVQTVSVEFDEFVDRVRLSVPEIAGMIGEPARNIQRVRNGAQERQPYVVEGRIYAKLYYHCGIAAANPSKIPGVNRFKNPRAWNEAKYQSWVREQGNPVFVSKAKSVGVLITELVNTIENLLTDASGLNVIDDVSSDYQEELLRLRNLVRLMLLDNVDRQYELEVQSYIQLDDYQSGER